MPRPVARTRALGILAVLALALPGCTLAVKDAKTFVSMMPEGAPPMMGTYDFDLLDTITGSGCAVRGSLQLYAVRVPGMSTGGGAADLVAQAEAAAVFDALDKAPAADMMLITRTRSEGDAARQICATVFGRAARLKKGPTIIPKPLELIAAPAGTAAPTAAAAPAPAAVPIGVSAMPVLVARPPTPAR